jgi:hypothetical protein
MAAAIANRVPRDDDVNIVENWWQQVGRHMTTCRVCNAATRSMWQFLRIDAVLVPWKRINWKKNVHCELKGHGQDRTPHSSVDRD